MGYDLPQPSSKLFVIATAVRETIRVMTYHGWRPLLVVLEPPKPETRVQAERDFRQGIRHLLLDQLVGG